MRDNIVCTLFLVSIQYAVCNPDEEIMDFFNRTTPSQRQLYDFREEHQEPIGVLTTSDGSPVDIRDTFTMNTNQYINEHHLDLLKHHIDSNIPARIVHPKGTGAWGYFVLENDISKYTSADVFGVGKITPIFGRFSVGLPNIGGADTNRDLKGLALKFYTKEGNLDFLCINFPVYFYRDSINFVNFVNVFNRNPKNGLRDITARWDFVTRRPETLHGIFWLLSEYGIPNGYRKMDYFPIHTYEVRNKHGERYFVKFNFRTEQGIENLDVSEADIIAGNDPDYYTRDLYNAIEEKNYPVWTLELDIMSYKDIFEVNYDPFEINRLWKTGTYETVEVGKLIFNQNLENFFRDEELSAFNPGNLVPGIPGPIDSMFRGRRFAYRDTQIHRLGINHNKIPVNAPIYRKEYNRDGVQPVDENLGSAPIYYPNSFNGPIPYVDEKRPKDSLSLLQSQAIDLGEPAYFYNHILTNDEQQDRFINNTVMSLIQVAPYIQRRGIKLFTLIDHDLGKKLTRRLHEAQEHPGVAPPKVLKVSRKINAFKENHLPKLDMGFAYGPK